MHRWQPKCRSAASPKTWADECQNTRFPETPAEIMHHERRGLTYPLGVQNPGVLRSRKLREAFLNPRRRHSPVQDVRFVRNSLSSGSMKIRQVRRRLQTDLGNNSTIRESLGYRLRNIQWSSLPALSLSL